jgi:hypothetical protein
MSATKSVPADLPVPTELFKKVKKSNSASSGRSLIVKNLIYSEDLNTV